MHGSEKSPRINVPRNKSMDVRARTAIFLKTPSFKILAPLQAALLALAIRRKFMR
jgi:hypothetical protein